MRREDTPVRILRFKNPRPGVLQTPVGFVHIFAGQVRVGAIGSVEAFPKSQTSKASRRPKLVAVILVVTVVIVVVLSTGII